MSDINILYPAASNNIQIPRATVQANTRATEKENEAASTQSLVKSYFDSLRERSDGEAKKLLEDLENTPLSQITKMFSDVQTSTVDNTSRLFEDLRIKPTDEVNSVAGAMKPPETDAADNAQKTQKTAAALSITDNARENKVDETDKTDERDKTDEVDDGDLTENTLAKYVRKLTEKDQVSADNEKLNNITAMTIEAVQKTKQSFFRSAETGEIDRGGAYSAAEDFVKSYNSFANEIAGSENNTVAGKSEFISGMTISFRPRLERAGIGQNEDGELTLDREQFEKASDKELENAFGEKDSFADFIEGQAKQLAAYAQTDLYQRSSAYSDSGNITQVSNINGIYFNMLG
ncbi:MAG: hypothetical protein K5876_04100 [Ruminiclostridium sp.]|nr:hypothetical protein [Ruminiclostridium sp.]